MSLFTQLQVQNIRTHEYYHLTLSPGVTLITGPNGSGKTSLIEALYVALRGNSFKGSDGDILAYNTPWYRIDVAAESEPTRSVKFEPERSAGRKQFIIDTKTHYRLPLKHKYPVVLFDPEDLRLLSGSPSRRRAFIDYFISQFDTEYAGTLRRYERALRQRNALLKQPLAKNDDLFAWNMSLSEYGGVIMKKRLQYINELNQGINEVYRSIARTSDTVSMRYSEQLMEGSLQQKLLADLHSSVKKDTLLGFTSTGPHRHDIIFDFNNTSAHHNASRGETRSIVLALKLLEVAIIEAHTHKKPLILLDDVFSELDENRQSHLLIKEGYQTVITTTHYTKKTKAPTKKIVLD